MNFSLYIHYPFCAARCFYCGFSTAIEKGDLGKRYREALVAELERRADEPPWRKGKLTSIYFGGGTPSLMPPEYVEGLLEKIKSFWTTPPTRNRDQRSEIRDQTPPTPPSIEGGELEITLEANPEDCDLALFRAFHQAGVNRLSLGAQSLDPADLTYLRRTHSPNTVVKAVEIARQAGYRNISLDLIYGLPTQTPESFRSTVNACLRIGIDHLSAYTLSVEEGTPLARNVREHRQSHPDPDLAAALYAELTEAMSKAGFEHYELTNYALAGCRSQHNFAYWQRTPYLGIGSGAHSFDCERRFWNRHDVRKHIDAVENGENPTEGEEILSPEQALEEKVYLALRTSLGLTSELIELCNRNGVEEMLKAGFLERRGEQVVMKEAKWLMLDEVVLRVLPVAFRGKSI